jgi:UDP-N-acetylmuramate--alanine ligase
VLVEKLQAFGHRAARYAATMDNAVDMLRANLREGDLVLTLGAGNVWQAGDRLLSALRGS